MSAPPLRERFWRDSPRHLRQEEGVVVGPLAAGEDRPNLNRRRYPPSRSFVAALWIFTFSSMRRRQTFPRTILRLLQTKLLSPPAHTSTGVSTSTPPVRPSWLACQVSKII